MKTGRGLSAGNKERCSGSGRQALVGHSKELRCDSTGNLLTALGGA